MTVNEIVNLLPKGNPFRIEFDNVWEQLLITGECTDNYIHIMQEYGDYNVIRIEACDNGKYEYATVWLKAEKPVDDDPYKILDYALFEDSMFEYSETYKHYTILKASINPHNSEYVIQELGFTPRWSSLAYCKKYIKEQLNKDK